MISEEPDSYEMRGHRVPPLPAKMIQHVAQRTCEIIGIKKSTLKGKNTEHLVMKIERYGINVDVVDDDEWIPATRAMVDPTTGMICMPERLYDELSRGKIEAIRIYLHELGHVVLGHRAMLHFSDARPTEQEDSEWQADYFADAILDLLGLPKEDRQLELRL